MMKEERGATVTWCGGICDLPEFGNGMEDHRQAGYHG